MKKKTLWLSSVIALYVACFYSCNSSDDIPLVSLGIDDYYQIPRMQSFRFRPGYTGEAYRWTMRLSDGRDSLLSTERNYVFLEKNEGTYEMCFELIDPSNPYKHEFKVDVVHEDVEYSPYISSVYEYKPAPGQFVNQLPRYENGDTEESMRKKVEENISGRNDVMITLGGFGGYITFSFDHTVMNVKGEKDFAIYGNAFYDQIVGDNKGGSAEPGIVMVAFDKNKNGKPDDDEWYEIAGSEYYKPETVKEYKITFYRPDPNKPPTPDASGNLTDTTYIRWKDNQGGQGYMSKIMFHAQDYFPKWIKADELTFTGTRLKDNAEDISGFGQYFILYSYDWGYVDNRPNQPIENISFDIDWAVDKDGNKVHLPGVDFIRVYTGLNQSCGRLGETSTEIVRGRDLHIDAPADNPPIVMPDNEIEMRGDIPAKKISK